MRLKTCVTLSRGWADRLAARSRIACSRPWQMAMLRDQRRRMLSDGPLLRELVLIILGIRRLRGEDHLEEARRVLEVALDLRDLRRLAAVVEQLEDVDGQDDDGADVVTGLRVSVDRAPPTHDVPRLCGLLEADARALDDRLGALDAGLARALVARVLVAARKPGLRGQRRLRNADALGADA